MYMYNIVCKHNVVCKYYVVYKYNVAVINATTLLIYAMLFFCCSIGCIMSVCVCGGVFTNTRMLANGQLHVPLTPSCLCVFVVVCSPIQGC